MKKIICFAIILFSACHKVVDRNNDEGDHARAQAFAQSFYSGVKSRSFDSLSNLFGSAVTPEIGLSGFHAIDSAMGNLNDFKITSIKTHVTINDKDTTGRFEINASTRHERGSLDEFLVILIQDHRYIVSGYNVKAKQ